MAVSGFVSLRTQYIGPTVANTAATVGLKLDLEF